MYQKKDCRRTEPGVLWHGKTAQANMNGPAEHQFYVNFGMGGMVLEEEEAVAWAELFKDEVFTAE